MTNMLDFITSMARVRRHIDMYEDMRIKISHPYLVGRTSYDFVGSDVHETLMCVVADSLLWESEQAIDLAETLCLDTLHYAADYKWLVSIRDWAIEEVRYWYDDSLSHIQLACILKNFEFTIPSLSSRLNGTDVDLRTSNLLRYFDSICRV